MTDRTLGSTFTIPANPDPEVLAWPYFYFADLVGLPMERLDEWKGHLAVSDSGVHRTMCLVDVDGEEWLAEGDTNATTPTPVCDADVRAWARSKHVPVASGGRVPRSVRTAYDTWAANYLGPWPDEFRITRVADGGGDDACPEEPT